MAGRRLLLVALGAALLAGAPTAHGGPRCPMGVDARGDASAPMRPGPLATQLPAADLLSVDVVSDRRALAATLRVAGAPAAPDPTSPLGYTYALELAPSPERSWVLQAVHSPEGDHFFLHPKSDAVANGPSPSAPIDGVIDLERGQVRFRVALASFDGDLEPDGEKGVRALLARTLVNTARTGTTGGASTVVDYLEATPRYVAGTRACIRVTATP